jgi:hypothetical protein
MGLPLFGRLLWLGRVEEQDGEVHWAATAPLLPYVRHAEPARAGQPPQRQGQDRCVYISPALMVGRPYHPNPACCGAPTDIRSLYIAFALNLLECGDAALIVRVAELKGFVSAIFKLLKEDPLEACWGGVTVYDNVYWNVLRLTNTHMLGCLHTDGRVGSGHAADPGPCQRAHVEDGQGAALQ